MALTVEELEVRLKADASQLTTALKASESGFKSVEKSVKNLSDEMERKTKGLRAYVDKIRDVATAVVGVLTALGAVDFFKASIESFKTMKEALDELQEEADLAGTIEAKPWWEVDEATADYKEFTKETARATAQTDLLVVSLLKEAAAMGYIGESAQKAVTGAMGLAKLTKFAPDWLLEATLALGEGKTDKLEKVLPALKGITDQAERLRIANKFIAQGFAEAEKAAETWEGQLANLTNEYESFKVTIGGVASSIVDTLKLMSGGLWMAAKQALKGLADTANSVATAIGGPFREVFGDLLSGLDLSFDGVKRAIENFVAFTKLIFMNLSKIIGPIWQTFTDVLVTGIDYALGAITGLIGMLSEAGAGSAAVKVLTFAFELLVTAVTSAWLTVKLFVDVISSIVSAIMPVSKAVEETATNMENAGTATEEATKGVSKFATAAAKAVEVGMTLARMAAAIAGTVAVAAVAYKAFNLVVAFGIWLWGVLHIQQIASIIVWGVWTAAVMVAKVVMFVFNAQLVLWNTLLSIGVVGTTAWTAGVLVAKTATWLWNAALTVTEALLAPAILLAAAGTFVIIGTALIAVGSAAWGAVKATGALIELIRGVDFAATPIGKLGEMFSRWGGAIKEVAEAAKTDLPSAFKLLTAHFNLAIEEVKALFPPLWDYISRGFKILADTVSQVFKVAFKEAREEAEFQAREAITFSPFGKTERRLEKERQHDLLMKSLADQRQSIIDLAGTKLEKLGVGIKVDETEGVTEAKRVLEVMRKAVADAAASPDKKKSMFQQIQDMFLGGAVDPKAASEAREKLKAEAAALTEKFQPPEIKFEKTVKHLDELLNLEKGAISWETYSKAVAEAKKELHGTADALKSINAILAGSLEARLLMFNQMMMLQSEDLMPSKPGPAKIPELDMKLIRDWDRLEGLTMGGDKSAVDLLQKIADNTAATAEKDPVILEGADIA